MTLTTGFRKFALTLHVVASVGWVGAVAGFLALAVAGFVSPDIVQVRASYVAMDLTYNSVIIPLGLASLATGVISSLGTEWGLFRHYWVLIKLLLTVPTILMMLEHARLVGYMANAVVAAGFLRDDLSGPRIQLISYACLALLVLLVATVLSTYKPRGRTLYWVRRLERRTQLSHHVEFETADRRPALEGERQ
ncbi:MAG: hypothetical protein KGO02_00610 [Alphaproteobacteria bacterium]|nr:hypothetical protein [Alphaproteobacteria bacterium]